MPRARTLTPIAVVIILATQISRAEELKPGVGQVRQGALAQAARQARQRALARRPTAPIKHVLPAVALLPSPGVAIPQAKAEQASQTAGSKKAGTQTGRTLRHGRPKLRLAKPVSSGFYANGPTLKPAEGTNPAALTVPAWQLDPSDPQQSRLALEPGDIFVDSNNPDHLPMGLAGPRVYLTDSQYNQHQAMSKGSLARPMDDVLFGPVQTFAAVNSAIHFADKAYGKVIDFARGGETFQMFLTSSNKKDFGVFQSIYGKQLAQGGPTPVVIGWRSWTEGSSWQLGHKEITLGYLQPEQFGGTSAHDVGQSRQTPIHELGHGISFSIRPDWEKPEILKDVETRAIQEGFADFFAIANLLQDAAVTKRIDAEFGGKLKKAKFIAQFAYAHDDVVEAYRKMEGLRKWKVDRRSAINCFTYQDSKLLDFQNPTMGNVAHPTRFNALVAGTFFDLTAVIERRLRAQGAARPAAEAAFVVTSLVLRGLSYPPANQPMRLPVLLQGMLEVDRKDFGGGYADAIREVAKARRISCPQRRRASALGALGQVLAPTPK